MSRHSGLKKSASLQDGLASPSENASHHARKDLFRQQFPPFVMFMVIHFFGEVKQKIAAQRTFFTRFLPALVLSYRYRRSWQFIVYKLQLTALRQHLRRVKTTCRSLFCGEAHLYRKKGLSLRRPASHIIKGDSKMKGKHLFLILALTISTTAVIALCGCSNAVAPASGAADPAASSDNSPQTADVSTQQPANAQTQPAEPAAAGSERG